MELTECPICKGKLNKNGKENTAYKVSGYCENCDIDIEIKIEYERRVEDGRNSNN